MKEAENTMHNQDINQKWPNICVTEVSEKGGRDRKSISRNHGQKFPQFDENSKPQIQEAH